MNSYKPNSRRPARQETRAIVTALAEREHRLLLTQLAQGRFAGFWLLPSATPDEGTVAETLRRMLPARTGYPLFRERLESVVEEPKTGVLSLRFVFRVQVGDREASPADSEIAQARWFTREAAREVLQERDIVPNLGVMSLVRSWVEGIPLSPLELLVEDALCPCGSGYRFPGCCGWDAR